MRLPRWGKSDTPQDTPPTTSPTSVLRKPTPDPVGYDWACRVVNGPLTSSKTETTMWFVLHNQSVDWGSVAQGEATILAQSRGYIGLVGRTIHTRVTSKPYPASVWAANLDHDTPEPVNAAAWGAVLTAKQRRLKQANTGEVMAFVGIPIGGKNTLNDALAKVRRYDDATVLSQRSVRLQDEQAALTALISDIARPATQREVEWLMHRSRGLCLPEPLPTPTAGDQPMDVWDLGEIYDAVDMYPPLPGARSVTLVGSIERNGAAVERAVTVLSVGRMDRAKLRVPEQHAPWLGYLHQWGPVEVSMRTRIVSGEDAAKLLEKRIRVVLEQIPQLRAQGESVPLTLSSVEALAPLVKHEMEEGHPEEAVRAYTHIRLAIGAANTAAPGEPSNARKNVEAAANSLKKHMDAVRIPLHRLRGQVALVREFNPHEPLATTAHLRRMPMQTFAAAIPNVSAQVGDRVGMHWGSIIGATGGEFFWHLHRGMEELDQPGLTPVIGQKGSGKSTAIGAICAISALRGIHTTVLDPSGPLARLCQWGPIKAVSEHIDLLSSQYGTLSPYSVVPEPTRVMIAADREYASIVDDAEREQAIDAELERQKIRAGLQREALALDTLRQCLSADFEGRAMVEATLSKAIRLNGSRITASLNGVMEHLAADPSEIAQEMWETLDNVRRHPRAELFFHSSIGGFQRPRKDDPTLLVITMPGLTLPTVGTPKAQMNTDERLAIPLLNLAAHYASSRIYRRGMAVRKIVALDEAHWLAEWPSGRALMSRLERDDRKWNVRTFVASQDVSTALAASKQSKALVSDAIVGFLEDPTQQEMACDLVHIGRDFANTFAELKSPENTADGRKWRHFMVRLNGVAGKVSIDLRDFPELADLLDTSPEQAVRERDLVGAGRLSW